MKKVVIMNLEGHKKDQKDKKMSELAKLAKKYGTDKLGHGFEAGKELIKK